MPSCDTQGCRGKPKANEALCSKCKSDLANEVVNAGTAEDDISAPDSAVQQVMTADSKVTVVNELLMYVACHRSGSTRDNTIRVLCSFYCEEEIKAAKDLLWNSCSSLNCLDEYIDRRESINKPKVHALCEDIYKAIGQIQDQERTVSFYAADWSIVPKVKPESITDVSTAEKLSLLEAKFDIMCNRVSSLEGDTKTHSALIYEVSQKLVNCNTAAVEEDQPGEDQSDLLADPVVPDNSNHQQPQPTGGDEAQEKVLRYLRQPIV